MADEPDLQYGSEGEWVTYLQQWLAHLGHYDGAADGSFGPATQQAVHSVQAQYVIGDGGAVGAETWHLITMVREQGQTAMTHEWGASEVNTVDVPEIGEGDAA